MTPQEFKAARLALGLTHTSLAAWAHIASSSTVHRYETGKAKIPGPLAVLLRATVESEAIRSYFNLGGVPAPSRGRPAIDRTGMEAVRTNAGIRWVRKPDDLLTDDERAILHAREQGTPLRIAANKMPWTEEELEAMREQARANGAVRQPELDHSLDWMDKKPDHWQE